MALTQVKALGLAADSIDETKLADDSIDSEHYNDGSIDNAHLAANSVDSDNYVDGSIDNAHLADNAVDTDEIADDAVTLAKMAGGTDGQIITYDASGDPVAVGPGTDGQVLTSTGAGSPPAFEDAAGGVDGISSSADATAITIDSSENVGIQTTAPQYKFEVDTTATEKTSVGFSANGESADIRFRSNNVNEAGVIRVDESGGGGLMRFHTKTTGGTLTQNLEIETDGDVKLNTGNLVIGTSGKGIDFSATGDAGGMTNELLDDYEEGTWTPVLKDADSGGNTYSGGGNWTTNATYTKIGRMVHVYHVAYALSDTGMTGANGIFVHGFPFTASGTHCTFIKLQYFQNFTDDEFGPYIQVNNGQTIGRLHKQHNEGGATSNVPIKWEDKDWDNYFGFQYYMTYHIA